MITRNKLLDAAIDCLAEFGYCGTTTTRVCERAEVSRGAQLHHFRSKEELLTAAVDHLARRRFAEIKAQAAQLPDESTDGTKLHRIRRGVDLLWSTFSGPLFYGAMEVWQAGRTDSALQETVYTVERSLGREVRKLTSVLFPYSFSNNEEFRHTIDVITYLMRGVALTRLLKDDKAEEERVLVICTDLVYALPVNVPACAGEGLVEIAENSSNEQAQRAMDPVRSHTVKE